LTRTPFLRHWARSLPSIEFCTAQPLRYHAGRMPLLHSNQPLSLLHQRMNKSAVLLSVLAGIAFGWWQAKECAAIAYGYAAGYSFAAAVFFGVSFSILGLLLAIYWRTRWFGYGLIAAGILSCAVFYGGIYLLLKQDRVAWRHEPPMVSIGPDVKASAVIYFRKGVTSQEVESFNLSVLMIPGIPQHDYLRLLPDQANGHEGIAITFLASAPADKVTAALATIKADTRVEKVYMNVTPDSIEPDSTPR
jgi:hypothetical protein